jgi:hypothetical protein
VRGSAHSTGLGIFSRNVTRKTRTHFTSIDLRSSIDYVFVYRYDMKHL